jgi:hypothetical protein
MFHILCCVLAIIWWFAARRSIHKFVKKRLPAWCQYEVLVPNWVGFVPAACSKLLRSVWVFGFIKAHPIAGLVFYPRKWFGETWDWLVCSFWGNFDSLLFCSIVFGVYAWLRRKPQYKKEGTFEFLTAFSSGIKVGALIAGFGEFGRYLDPRNIKGCNLVADMLALIGKMFKDEPAKDSTELPVEEDQDDGFLDSLRKIIPGVKKICATHRSRVAMFCAAVLCGVLLFAFFHQRSWFDSFVDHEARSSGKKRRGNINKKMKQVRKATKGKKKNFVLYDAADRADITNCVFNGAVVKCPLVGEPFGPGHWVLTRLDGSGGTITDDFDITFGAEAIPAKCAHCGVEGHVSAMCPDLPKEVIEPIRKVPTPTLPVVFNKGQSKPKKDKEPFIQVGKSGKHKRSKSDGSKEALVAGSVRLDTRHVRHALGEAWNNGVFSAQIVVAWCGILVNKHVYDECTHFKFGDKLVPKTKISYHEVSGNKDLLVCACVDGVPKVPKARFAVPELNQKVSFIAHNADSWGSVTYIGPGREGHEMRTNCSTLPGDCGGPYVNANGAIVGIHFAAGGRADNSAIPVSDSMLQLQPKN